MTGRISRHAVAEVLIESLHMPVTFKKTFEVISQTKSNSVIPVVDAIEGANLVPEGFVQHRTFAEVKMTIEIADAILLALLLFVIYYLFLK